MKKKRYQQIAVRSLLKNLPLHYKFRLTEKGKILKVTWETKFNPATSKYDIGCDYESGTTLFLDRDLAVIQAI